VPVDLDQLGVIVKRMASKPWRDGVDCIETECYEVVVGIETSGSCVEMAYTTLILSDDDKAGIVALRNAYEAMSAELRELRERLAETEEE